MTSTSTLRHRQSSACLYFCFACVGKCTCGVVMPCLIACDGFSTAGRNPSSCSSIGNRRPVARSILRARCSSTTPSRFGSTISRRGLRSPTRKKSWTIAASVKADQIDRITPLDRGCTGRHLYCVSRPDGRPRQCRKAAREESPGSMDIRCRITSGGFTPRESATENKPPRCVAFGRGKGETVR
jgi:hypothetical protein